MPLLPPPLVALAAGLGQRAITGPRSAPTRASAAAAGVVAAASLALTGSAVQRFRRSGTTVEPFRPEQATKLVTTGANAISRNPMYVGMAGLLVAHAVWRGSPAALVPVAAFVAYIDRVQVEAEEAALLEKFGPEYAAYCEAVPRWLGPR